MINPLVKEVVTIKRSPPKVQVPPSMDPSEGPRSLKSKIFPFGVPRPTVTPLFKKTKWRQFPPYNYDSTMEIAPWVNLLALLQAHRVISD